ncbi:MAG: GNAT family N-acetyltransferase [Actinopolymorphaceae bacterium]
MTAASTRLAGMSPMTQEYAEQVLDIYRRGIASGHATFETEPPTWDTFTATRLADHSLVATDPTGNVLGWVACSPESGRCVYAGVVEHSVYVHPDAGGKGVGRHHGVWRDVVLIERPSPTVG